MYVSNQQCQELNRALYLAMGVNLSGSSERLSEGIGLFNREIIGGFQVYVPPYSEDSFDMKDIEWLKSRCDTETDKDESVGYV